MLALVPTQSPTITSPEVILAGYTDGFDLTMVDTGNSEALTIRQIDDAGCTHTIVLSPSMVVEAVKLMLQWDIEWKPKP
ncbi:hypothetical protein D3Y57_05430 [Sphingomonas paeninsulae]|uniref:Uncharacterized protein n=1 Tax=Sphingomonas paeninsulae TaxID=2319844 RepID=A0A494TE35_SPHPE|nr:hypothetical protein D3Y57_05430 [Sphingomonas paeninsulae]